MIPTHFICISNRPCAGNLTQCKHTHSHSHPSTQSDSSHWKGVEKSRTLRAPTTFFMSRKQKQVSSFFLPHSTFHTFHMNVCFFLFLFYFCFLFFCFTRSRESIQCSILCLTSFWRSLYKDYLFYLVQLLLCIVIVFFFLQSNWKSCFSLWVFMSSWANHKDSFPMLSFPHSQWESWPRAWALVIAPTTTHVSLLPVIGDYIRLGNKDILGCRGSDELPCRHPREWNNWTFHSDADGRRSCWHSQTSLCTKTALEIWIKLQIIQRSITTLILAFLCHFSGYLSLKVPDLKVLVSCLHVLVWLCGFHRFG